MLSAQYNNKITYCVEAVEIKLTHGKAALPSVMGELAEAVPCILEPGYNELNICSKL